MLRNNHTSVNISHTTQLIGAMVRVALIAITQLTTIKIREKEKVVAWLKGAWVKIQEEAKKGTKVIFMAH